LRLEIVHSTRYSYTSLVFLEPHVLRFRPRSNSWQRLLDFDLRIEPHPMRTSGTLDSEGNEALMAWFGSLTHHLDFDVYAAVETVRENPFDYLWTGARQLPMRYESDLEVSLSRYRQAAASLELRDCAEEATAAAKGDAQTVLVKLAEQLHASCRHIHRPEGDPWPPEETLRRREGACRDLAVLYIAVARELGFAARFVSGYCAAEDAEQNELHAWAEVYIPGGGWRGFDPSTGFAVSDRHVAVAAGATSDLAAPVSGTFRGSGRALPVQTEVAIRCLD
jgi:transglutaminase-like putative cysteine protease